MRGEKLAIFVACAAKKSKDVVQNRRSNKHKEKALKKGYEQLKREEKEGADDENRK
jgi:hypothetical protein